MRIVAGNPAWKADDSEYSLETSELVRGELKRVIGSHYFDASDQNRRFLQYVVEEALAGRGDRLELMSVRLRGRQYDKAIPALHPESKTSTTC